MENLPPEAMLEVAAYFQALSESTRLKILNPVSYTHLTLPTN